MRWKYLLTFVVLIACHIGIAQTYRFQNVTLLSHWDNPNQLSLTQFHNQKYNGSWGWTDTIKHREYALVGSVTGTYFVDVTDPYIPVECDYLQGCSDTLGNIHREIKSYSHYAFIMCDAGCDHAFQIVDMQYLPDSIHIVNDTNKFHSHTLYIDEPNAKLYLTSVKAQILNQNYYSDLDVYDLTNPEAPALLRSITSDYPNLLGQMSHDCFARNDTIYVSDGNNGYYVFKQSDTSAFILLGSLTNYPNSSLNHSSWLTDNGKYAVMCEEDAKNVIKIVDLQDISSMNIIGSCTSNPDTSAIHHNPFVVGNDRVVVACYSDGVQIFDLSDPTNPLKIGYFDTFYQNDNDTVVNLYDFRGCWGAFPYLKSKHLLALDTQNGLYVMDASSALKVEALTNTLSSLNVYPNPAADQITLAGNGGKIKIKIYDVLGHVVLEKEMLSTVTLNTSHLKPGIYTLVGESSVMKSITKVAISR